MNELDLIRVEAQITCWQREALRRVRERMAAEQKGEAFYDRKGGAGEARLGLVDADAGTEPS